MSKTKRQYNSVRRTQAKQQTMLDIVEAAVTMHSAGITAVEEVAKEAGVSAATVRKYFPTQEDLFKGCTLHFSRKYSPPSPEQWAQIDEASERISVCVEQLYAFLEISMGVTWLAFRTQDESPVMKQTLLHMEQYIDVAVNAVFGKKQPKDAFARKAVRSVLHPLYYRTLRLHGGFQPDDCIRFSSNTIASILNNGGIGKNDYI